MTTSNKKVQDLGHKTKQALVNIHSKVNNAGVSVSNIRTDLVSNPSPDIKQSMINICNELDQITNCVSSLISVLLLDDGGDDSDNEGASKGVLDDSTASASQIPSASIAPTVDPCEKGDYVVDPHEEEEESANPTIIDHDEEYQHWLSKVKTNGRLLQQAPEVLRDDKNLVLAAVENNSEAFQFASLQRQNDKDIVMAAVRQNGWMLQFIPDDDGGGAIRNDKDVIMAAVRQNGRALKYASPQLQNDKEVVLIAIKQNPDAVKYVSPELKTSKEIAMAAVQQNGRALQFVSKELRNDKEVVSVAVQHDKWGWWALQFASPQLQQDKDVILMMVKSHPDAIKHVHKDFIRDPDILTAAGMFDENHDDEGDYGGEADEHNGDDDDKRQMIMANTTTIKKITLSTRFSLDPKSHSEATNFTKLLKANDFIRKSGFKVYVPNAFDKKTCDPNWTDFNHPCRGTRETCQYDNVLNMKTGHPTDDCCWRYSFRYQLEDAKKTGGFMLQLVEKVNSYSHNPPTLGNGQMIERDMAQNLKMKIFHVYRPVYDDKIGGHEWDFYSRHIEEVVAAIKKWYDEGCQDMSECAVRPRK